MVTRVDVCLATYNGARFLPRQLASLQAQDVPDLRILLQDDGSTDATPSLLHRICAADSRFVPGAQSGAHLGAAGNFISLIRQSDAPYTALCDQDDEWEPDRLSACLAEMARLEAQYGPDTPLLVHSDARLIDADGRELHPSFFAHQGWDPDAVRLCRLLVQNNVTGCTLMMNAALRRLVAAHARPDTTFMHDWFIALTAAAFGHIRMIPRPLVRYRQHGANVLGASRTGALGRIARALTMPGRARERMALNYRNARAFRDACADVLPAESLAVLDRFLATQSLPWPARAIAVMRQGCTMQSRLTRLGQFFFS